MYVIIHQMYSDVDMTAKKYTPHKATNTKTSTSGLSRKQRVYNLLKKSGGKKMTGQSILDRMGFGSDYRQIKTCLEELLTEDLIKSELGTAYEGLVTVYYVSDELLTNLP
jgi:hypothetical protein